MYLSGVELIFRTITTLVKLLSLNYTKFNVLTTIFFKIIYLVTVSTCILYWMMVSRPKVLYSKWSFLYKKKVLKKKLLDFSSIMQQKKLIAEQCSKKRPLGTLPFFFMPYESNIEETASTFSSCEKKKRTLFEATTGNPRNTLLGCLKFLRYAFFVNYNFLRFHYWKIFFLYIQVPLY